MTIFWILLGLIGWALGVEFVLILMRMAGDSDRAGRRLAQQPLEGQPSPARSLTVAQYLSVGHVQHRRRAYVGGQATQTGRVAWSTDLVTARGTSGHHRPLHSDRALSGIKDSRPEPAHNVNNSRKLRKYASRCKGRSPQGGSSFLGRARRRITPMPGPSGAARNQARRSPLV
jgi:hypothetical protein